MNEDHHKKLKLLEIELANPEVRKDVARISDLISDDFEEFGSSGTVIRKLDFLESAAGSPSPSYELSGFQFQDLAKGCTLVKYKSMVLGRVALRASIWVLNDGNWKILHHQSTVVPNAN